MKKITLMLCLLFVFSMRLLFAQTLHLPLIIEEKSDKSEYSLVAVASTQVPVPAEMNTTFAALDKISMTSSPNPFTTRTQVTCCLPSKGKLSLGIRNMFGETVKTRESNVEQEGDCVLEVTSENLRPGVYTAILVFKTSDNVLTKTIRIVYNQ
jgi:hypothetical protein